MLGPAARLLLVSVRATAPAFHGTDSRRAGTASLGTRRRCTCGLRQRYRSSSPSTALEGPSAGSAHCGTGQNLRRHLTVRGTRKDAEADLARLLDAAHKGVLPDASKITVETYLWQWLDGKHDLSPVTRERYADADRTRRSVPHARRDRACRSSSRCTSSNGSRRCSARDPVRTVANICSSCSMARIGGSGEARTRSAATSAAAVTAAEDQNRRGADTRPPTSLRPSLASLSGSRLLPIASARPVATGMRRGELLALRWSGGSVHWRGDGQGRARAWSRLVAAA